MEAHTSPEDGLLQRITRETHRNVLMPRMLSGHLQGRVLSTFSHMLRPDRILEIGTFTGYAAICMAEGLNEGGKLITIDKNEELEERVRGYLADAGVNKSVEYIVGDAMAIIPTLDETFDLVFIDADKDNYANYFDMLIDKVRPNGYLIADNVLWSGKVLLDEGDSKFDHDTRALRDFSKKVQDDGRVENVLFPVRDGLMVMRKL